MRIHCAGQDLCRNSAVLLFRQRDFHRIALLCGQIRQRNRDRAIFLHGYGFLQRRNGKFAVLDRVDAG